jgi:predicted ester cyclase
MHDLEMNKAIVRRFNKEVIEDGKVEVFHELVSPDVINRTAPAGTLNNGEAMLFLIMNVLRPAIPDLTVEIHDQIAEGDLVVTRKSLQGTHTKEFMTIKPSGKKVTIPIIDIIRLRDGKYIEHWGIRDMQQVIKAASTN